MKLRAAEWEAPRSGAGLVPSINNVETMCVEHVQARCTRLRKNLGVAAKWLSKGAGQAYMLTLTYRGVHDWKPEHIRAALDHLRKWLKRSYGWSLRYLWVMELQKRGAPHYHVVVWVPRELAPADLHLDARGWWPHGMTNSVRAVAPVRYVMKYVSKFDSPDSFPKGARCYGIGGLDVVGRSCRRWINWPRFVQARADVNTPVHRVRGGGWLVAGARYASEWGLSAIGRGYTRLLRLCTHPPGPLAGALGPFSFWSPAFAAHAG
jgi:hypothetical protein